MLTRITIANLKGITRTVELDKINLIHGPNGSGKTAIIDGLKLSMLGYHPRLGKKPNLTFQLASPGVTCMTVATDIANITWSRNLKGAVTVDGLEGLGDMPTVMLDLQEWLALSGPAKIQYVIEHSGQVLGDSVDKVDRLLALNPKVDLDSKKLDRKDTAKFLRELGALAKANRSTAQTELDVVQGAINQSLTSAGKPPENPERELRGVTKQIEEQQKTVTELQTKKNILEKRIAVLEKQLEKTPHHDVSGLEDKGAAEKKSVESAVSEASLIERELSALKIEEVSLSERHRALKAELFKLVETVESVKATGICPACGQKATTDHVSSMEEQVENSSMSLEELSGELESIREALTLKTSVHRDKKGDVTGALQKVSATEAEIAKRKASNTVRADILKQFAESQKELTEAPSPPTGLPELIAKRDTLSQQAKEFAAWKGTERERSRAIEEKSIKHQALEHAKELIAAIKEAEEGLLKQVIGGLLFRANVLVEPVLGRPLEYRDGEFCLGGANLNTASGSEECVIFAGLQLALTPLLPERILVLDEIRRMDGDRMERLLVTIEELVKRKVITQFVGALPGDAPKSSVEYNSIKCGGEK
jgi:hypothetical protein